MNHLRVARMISVAAHPFVLVPLTISLASGNIRWAAITAAVTILPVFAVMAWKVRRGVWSNYDVSRQDQRSGLYWIAIPVLLGAIFLLDAPPRFTRGMIAFAAALVIGLAGNRLLKTSMHMMFAAWCTVILARAYPMSLVAMLPVVAALAWSRRRLDRHTLAEIIAGVILGVAAGLYSIAE